MSSSPVLLKICIYLSFLNYYLSIMTIFNSYLCGRHCHKSHKRVTHMNKLYWTISLCHPLPYIFVYFRYYTLPNHFCFVSLCVRAWFCIHLARSMRTADSLIVTILKRSEILWGRRQRETWVPVTEYPWWRHTVQTPTRWCSKLPS